MTRWEIYRAAGRTLKYRTYFVMELIIVGLIVAAFFSYWNDSSLAFLGWAAAALTIVHNGSLNLEKPWKLLKCASVAALTYFVIGAITDASLAALIAFSIFCTLYLIEGELDTRARARSALSPGFSQGSQK